MLRLVRQLVAILLATAWIAGILAPAAFADAPIAPTAAAAAHDAAPCHGGDPSHTPDQDTGKPCPFFPLCSAKCFQVVPTVLAPVITPMAIEMTSLGHADDYADGHSPSPPLKIPRT